MNNPEYDPVKDSEALQSLVNRMAQAKWLDGMQFVSPYKDSLKLSAFGREQMNKAYLAIIENCPDAFTALESSRLSKEAGEKQTARELLKSVVAGLGLQLGVILIRTALEPPPFSKDEALALIGLLIKFARQKQPPPENGGEAGPRFKI